VQKGKKVIAFIPGDKFPAISITDYSCDLMCDFCRGKYLRGMVSVRRPEELYNVAREIWEKGGIGLLVSGGFDKYGKLPVKPYLGVLERIKKDFELIISIHPGFLELEMIKELKKCKVDVIDYEFAFDPTLLKYMHLNLEPNNVVKHFRECLKVGFGQVVPHILLGLNGHISEWNYRALEVLSPFDISLIVLLVFIPTRGTPLEFSDPPPVREIVNYVNWASNALQRTEIALGCMRPISYKDSLDEILVKNGFISRIANPHKRLIKKYSLPMINACCSIPLDYFNGITLKRNH